jgi:uncharacterized protein YbjT (DUF2867 family)/membrane protease YdiL (CAAX protease family)
MVGKTLLLTGATGFVGSAVRPALLAKGWRVRCLTRDMRRARKHAPELDWVEGDVSDPGSCARALEGCYAALYLIHGIGEGADYHEHEVGAAVTFARAAHAAGVERLVYLGGVAPMGSGSAHLRSRLEVGEALRAGPVKAIELRASMIVGHGSLSWLIVRDLAARLPVMVLPRWLKSRTEPVAINDVVVALVGALDLQLEASAWFDVPGPDAFSGSEILVETSRLMGLRRPRMIAVPFLTPRLSSLWVRFVTRARWSVAREVVIGLTEDLLAHDNNFWQLIDHSRQMKFSDAARLALETEQAEGPVRGAWGAIERALKRLGRTPPQTGDMSLALACIAAWTAAAAGTGRVGVWIGLGGIAVALGSVALVLDPADTRHLLRPSPRLILIGLAVGCLMGAATLVLYPVLARLAPSIASDTARLYGAFRALSPAFASVVLVPVVLAEELVWRGVIQGALERRLGARRGVALAAGVYALGQAPLGSPALVLAALACGLSWGALRSANRSLVPTLVAHLVWDIVVLLWLPLEPG